MGRIQIFKLPLSDRHSNACLQLIGGREFEREEFYLGFGELVLSLPLDQAENFASSVRRLAARLRASSPTAGAVYRRQVGDGVKPGLKLEFGVTEDGCIYVEVGSTKIHCDAAQSDQLISALSSFAADVSFVASCSPHAPRRSGLAQGPPGPTECNVIPGLRGIALPRWADEIALPRWADDSRW